MLAYQQSHGFDDFYNSVQAIPDTYEANEGFGREVRQQIYKPKFAKSFKKIVSVENFNGLSNYDNNDPTSFSTSTFEENDNDFTPYKKTTLAYVYEDQSTMSSFSAFNSMGSMSSMNGAMHNSYKNSKNKFFGSKKKNLNPGETDFRVKYKTEVCKYWAETGHCTFGDNCAFAHGKAEIRQKLHISSNYKTKKCVQFHENGLCPYGIRCQFIHCASRKENQLNPALKSNSYAEDLENIEIWCTEDADCHCMKRKTRSRLPCLVKMANEGASTEESDH